MNAPPIGVMPYYLWFESVKRSPSMSQLVERYVAVNDAIKRYKDSNLPVPPPWLKEVGIIGNYSCLILII